MTAPETGGFWRWLARRISGSAMHERMARLERALGRFAAAQRDDASAVRSRVAKLTSRLEERRSEIEVRDELRKLRQSFHTLSDRVARQEDPLFGAGRIQLLHALDAMAANDRPIIVGPWTGEVGFELLYWIPFVRWARDRFGLPVERLVVVSRGGVASWYDVPAERYIDIFSLIGADDFRVSTAAQSTLKQRKPGALDERILAAAKQRLGITTADVLHPSRMFKAFAHFWEGYAGHERLDAYSRYTLLTPPVSDRPPGLPSEYIAVRFYFRRSFPDKPQNRAFAHAVIAALAERSPVVVLASGARVDDHADLVPPSTRGVTIFAAPDLERNLAVQSAVLGGARAFVGTYGGYSYLAPLYGVPTVAFHSRRGFDLTHLYVAQRAFVQAGAAPLTVVDVSQAALVQSALASVGAPVSTVP